MLATRYHPPTGGSEAVSFVARPLLLGRRVVNTSTGTAIVYIDGFNLYYNLFRAPPESRRYEPALKWLDPYRLAQNLLPGFGIVRVEYFTAPLKAKYSTPGSVQRQRTYLQALEAIPRVVVHTGNFQVTAKWLPLVRPTSDQTTVRVYEKREKRSDVNLACRMLCDAAVNAADLLVLISNDSDFIPLLRTVRNDMNGSPALMCPANEMNQALAAESLYTKKIRRSHLENSQLPETINTPKRLLTRPPEWGAVQAD